MLKLRLSMRTSLWLAIVLMGLLGMVLALATGSIYRKLALDSQRFALVEMIKLQADDLLQGLEKRSYELGNDIQSEPAFRAALAARDSKTISSLLDKQFHRYFETAGVLKLEKLYVFDVNHALFSESSEGPHSTGGAVICGDLLKRASQRQGAQQLKSLADMCVFNGRPYFAVIVSVGRLRPNGYVVVVTDPSPSLTPIETKLGMPLRLAFADGSVFYRSRNWPGYDSSSNSMVADYRINSYGGDHVLSVSMFNDLRILQGRLEYVRNMVLLVAGAATLLTALMALWVMQKTALQPLRSLIAQIRLVQKDREHLGEQVSVSGNAEIRELAADFNAMTLELKELYETLEKMAFSDALTGLPNRTLFGDRVHQITLISQRRNARFALFIMDLDRFKQVNDTLGHTAGDKLLQQVAERLLGVLRKSDTVGRLQNDMLARLGGDEFAAILPMIGEADYATIAAKRILNEMSRPFEIDGNSFNVGVSIGIAVYPEDGADVNTLMRRADVAMYQAKHGQRGIAFYDSAQDQHSLSRLTLEPELRHALEYDGLELYYQPKIDMASGAICGAEALLRWQHAERGFIPPDTFIPLAEQTGLIQPLTQWVLNAALTQCARWHDEGFPLGVAVNLSARSLHDHNIIDYVAEALRSSGVAPEYLILELTESAIMTDPERAMEILTQLDTMGVLLSVDDFGTGYSSLAYLKKLPVDEIKIDKSFVIDMNDDSNDAVIVRSTIDLAHNMSLHVVAEGVENAEILQHLAELGCDIAQGYHLGRPLPADNLTQRLRETYRQASLAPAGSDI